jgi:hypothetical protein
MRYAPWIVYNHRARSRVLAAPAARPIGTSQARPPSTIPVIAPNWFGRPLQAVAVEHLANNRLQHTSYGMGILLCKTGDRGGGGRDLDIRRRRRRITPLRLFFANWPPSRLPVALTLLYALRGSVCTRCAAGCNRRVSVGGRVERAPRLAGPCWA